jgi:hypothetical protein
MISAAAMLILYEAVRQMIFGVEIQNLGIGVAVTAAAFDQSGPRMVAGHGRQTQRLAACCAPMACMCSPMSGRVWRC